MTKITIMTVDAIKSQQDTIRTNLVELDKMVHDNAVQCMIHAEAHGDTSLMVRLLQDTLGASKSGYRVQGLINWMRKHSPMELNGKTINLSGIVRDQAQVDAMVKAFPKADPKLFVIGERRPFMIQEANDTFFALDDANKETVKPVYQSVLLSPINAAHAKIKAAIENTKDGKPIDATKPYYDGVHSDKVLDFFSEVKKLQDALPTDLTKELRDAQKKARDAAELEQTLTKQSKVA